GQVEADRPGDFAVVGELALTGETRPIKGALAMALAASAQGRDGLLVPSANANEAAVVEGIAVYPVGSLAEAVGFLSGQLDLDPTVIDLQEVFQRLAHTEDDFVDVKGQDYAKRALVIAASGGSGSSTSCPDSAARRWRSCLNRWRRGASRPVAPCGARPSRPISSWWPP